MAQAVEFLESYKSRISKESLDAKNISPTITLSEKNSDFTNVKSIRITGLDSEIKTDQEFSENFKNWLKQFKIQELIDFELQMDDQLFIRITVKDQIEIDDLLNGFASVENKYKDTQFIAEQEQKSAAQDSQDK